MSNTPLSPDDDFDSGVGDSIFPSCPIEPPSNPEPPKPANPASGVSNLDTIFSGISPEARAAILKIVRNAGLRDDDPEIAILAAVRQHDVQFVELTSKVLDAIDKAPTRLHEAAQALSLARSDHEADVAESKKLLIQQRESQLYTEKMSRLNLTIGIALGVLFCMALTVQVATWVASEKAAGLTEVAKSFEESTEQIRKMQFVTNSRLLLQADENQLQSDWRKLQLDVSRNNDQTEEHQQRLERLKAWKAEIDAKWAEQTEKEKQVLQQ